MNQEFEQESKTFVQRLDFYWQYVAIYAIVLIIYALFKGTFSEGTFSVVLFDPVVILLAFFILSSTIVMGINAYKRKTIIIGSDYIIFKSRFRSKKYSREDIVRIGIQQKRFPRIPGSLHIVKIRIKKRRRTIKIRPSSFWNEKELIRSINNFKNSE